MKKRIVLWIVIGLLVLAALFLVFKAGSGGGIIPAGSTAARSAASSYGGMVGGC